jgi:hypothetical protein
MTTVEWIFWSGDGCICIYSAASYFLLFPAALIFSLASLVGRSHRAGSFAVAMGSMVALVISYLH